MSLRVVSYGGGVQSTALLVLAAQGKIDFPVFLFANVGDNAENPDTLVYVRDVARPYAEVHGITLHELRREWRDGRGWTLYDLLTSEKRSIGIPVRMSTGKPGNRACTSDFKIKVCAKWMRQHGATKTDKGLMALGISRDEWQRMRTSSGQPHYDTCYPLYELDMDRHNCAELIKRAGLPVPPKSSCYFCPFHKLAEWREMKRKQPELFERAVQLEAIVRAKAAHLERNEIYFTRFGVPLSEAVKGESPQLSLFEEDSCESGYCMT